MQINSVNTQRQQMSRKRSKVFDVKMIISFHIVWWKWICLVRKISFFFFFFKFNWNGINGECKLRIWTLKWFRYFYFSLLLRPHKMFVIYFIRFSFATCFPCCACIDAETVIELATFQNWNWFSDTIYLEFSNVSNRQINIHCETHVPVKFSFSIFSLQTANRFDHNIFYWAHLMNRNFWRRTNTMWLHSIQFCCCFHSLLSLTAAQNMSNDCFSFIACTAHTNCWRCESIKWKKNEGKNKIWIRLKWLLPVNPSIHQTNECFIARRNSLSCTFPSFSLHFSIYCYCCCCI